MLLTKKEETMQDKKKEETMQDKQNKLTPKQNPESHFLNGKPSMIFFINRSGKNTKKQKDC